jgi:predicted porin
MKKSLIALAALGAFAGAASAQSSVTLFGVVDLSLLATSNGGGKLKSMASNSYNSNRLGFRGVEDLGGGMRGAFWLEAGMGNDNGTVGSQLGPSTAGSAGSVPKMFNRRSTVSLMGGFGEVRLGRDYTPQFWNTTVFDAFGTNGPGSSLNVSTNHLGSGAGTFVRADNSLGYFLPGNLGGLYGQVQMSAGEGNVTNNGLNKHTSFRIGYAAGPLNVAVASGKTETGANDFKMTNFGASYKFGFGTLTGYSNKQTFGAVSEKLLHVGGLIPFGATTVRLGYTKNDTSGGAFATRDASQFAAGVVYDLSKRTAVYSDVSRISNKTGASYNNGGTANTAGRKANAFDIGVRHSF